MTAAAQTIQHIFVLMLENRSFDHMLGFSGIRGTDAETGQPTAINGLTGTETNAAGGKTYMVSSSQTKYTMPFDPPHEFPDVLRQLCGPGAQFAGGVYPAVVSTGFAASYGGMKCADPQDVMACYSPAQLPVLSALASEFAVLDNWHASMPGPTWPNRMFAHAASSAGLDHSPTSAEIVLWESLSGFSFPNGSIFDALRTAGIQRRLYAGDEFPMVASLKGIGVGDIRSYHLLAGDLASGNYPYSYIFIEPSYNVTGKYECGTSQHPLADVTNGERLIKCTYESIRNSPLWNDSLLVITWDEHGGFYDHAGAPAAVAPGDSTPGSGHNKYRFEFDRYGPRVPALAISPWIAKNRVDHRLYDHSSIPATIEARFGIKPLTARDAVSNNLLALLTLSAPRTDAPVALPAAAAGDGKCAPFECSAAPLVGAVKPADLMAAASQAPERINDGSLPGILQSALHSHLDLQPGDRAQILARVSSLATRADAQQYIEEVRGLVRAYRAATE
jgi:phospholipase C